MPSRYRNEVSKAVAVSRIRIKDPESARHYETDMAETADMVEQASYLAMAAMLLVRLHLVRLHLQDTAKQSLNPSQLQLPDWHV